MTWVIMQSHGRSQVRRRNGMVHGMFSKMTWLIGGVYILWSGGKEKSGERGEGEGVTDEGGRGVREGKRARNYLPQ